MLKVTKSDHVMQSAMIVLILANQHYIAGNTTMSFILALVALSGMVQSFIYWRIEQRK